MINFSSSNNLNTTGNETNQLDDEYEEDYRIEYEIAKMLELVFYPVIIILGSLGNVLSFFVMRRESLKNVSTCFYMSVLAIADTELPKYKPYRQNISTIVFSVMVAGFLWSGTLVEWLARLTHYEINAVTWGDCKIMDFLFFFSAHYSSSLLVIMSIEKFFALYFILKTRSICTVETARWACLIAAIVMFAWNTQNFFLQDQVTKDGFTYCVSIAGELYNLVQYRINSVIWSFGPFAIMFLTNSAIIYKFMKAKFKSSQSGTESTNQALSKNAVKGTAMLITVSLSFIALTFSSAIASYLGDAIYSNDIGFSVALILQYSNHGINAVLYCISGSRFRTEFVKMVCFCRKTELQRSTTTTTISTTLTSSNVTTNDSESALPQ